MVLDSVAVKSSVHGEAGIGCADCHAGLRGTVVVPHPAGLAVADCTGCHEKESQAVAASAHGPSAARGRPRTLCADCHGSHDIRAAGDKASRVSRGRVIDTCGRCHQTMHKDYLNGVHGKAYIEGSADVPVCTDCHGGHQILPASDEQSKVFAAKVAEACSRCHDDVKLAKAYGLLAGRMSTYVQSFHGAAAKFGAISVANCASCHGFHDIRASADPRSSVYPGNIPKTCGRCHPGATTNFADGQIHDLPGRAVPARYRLPALVGRIYAGLIAAVISVALLFIAADLFHRLTGRNGHG